MSRIAGVVLALCALGSSPASAAIVVAHELAGVYNAAGGYHNSFVGQNYRVGLSPITTTPEHRNFFIFDLTSYPALPMGSVIGAELKLYLPKFAPPGLLDPGDGYISPDASEKYRLSGTPITPAMLADPTNTTAEAIGIFSTLGTGPLAGDKLFTSSDMGMMATISLSPMAVGAINGLLGSGKIAFGGRIETFAGTHIDELLFAFTDIGFPHMAGKEPTLVIMTAVPEANAWMLALVATAVGGGAAVSRRPQSLGAGPATNSASDNS